ncbi:HEAT repeat domain-containing protein [Flavobacterium sp. RHBU_24]|uniref:HEAT repeat domain-containing protein n=1 Tax=Flavobacterium sp. RHBU_24 TaxID=3391185 RepID=UPI003985252D
MTELEKLENRWNELVGKPRTKEEIEESLLLSKKLEIERAKEHQTLTYELSNIGIKITSIWDLVNTKVKYPTAIPILLKHLRLNYSDQVKEGIVRALIVKEAKGIATSALIAEYEKTPKEKDNLRWVIGYAIANTMTSQDVNWILNTVADKSNMWSRSQLVVALGTVKTQQSEEMLISLLADEQVLPQAICALGMLRSQKAKEKIIELNKSMNSLVRLEASKALKKIG